MSKQKAFLFSALVGLLLVLVMINQPVASGHDLDNGFRSVPVVVQGDQWAIRYERTGYDAGYAMQTTNDGGVVVAGETYSVYPGLTDVWILKLDSLGNSDWQRLYGGEKFERALSIQQTSDGGFIVAGSTDSFDVGGGTGGTDAWVLRLAGNGDILWQKAYGGERNDEARDIQETSDGGFIFTGRINVGSHEEPWIVKLNSSGDVEWEKTIGIVSSDWVNSVREVGNGDLLVAGHTSSYGAGSDDMWLIRFSSEGEIIWQKTFGSTLSDGGGSIQVVSDGGFIVAGSTRSFGAGGQDAWILRLDDNGQIIWQRAYGGNADESASSVQATSDGGFIIAGSTESFGMLFYDAWVIKLDSLGNVLWQKTYGSIKEDYAVAVQEAEDGSLFMAGYTESFDAVGTDIWVLKLDETGDIGGCDIIAASNAVTTDTDVTPASSNTSAVDSSAMEGDTSAVTQATFAVNQLICYNPLSGDCTGDILVDQSDLSAAVLETFDGDGDFWLDTPKGTFPGRPGCDANEDSVVGAGDLSCTALILESGPGACSDGPVWYYPLLLRGRYYFPPEQSGVVWVPIYFDGKGNGISSLVFSLNYDEEWLTFDPADNDGNGLPDAIVFNLPPTFYPFVTFQEEDLDGELDFAIADFVAPLSELPADVISWVRFEFEGEPAYRSLAVAFSEEPGVTFGSSLGADVEGVVYPAP